MKKVLFALVASLAFSVAHAAPIKHHVVAHHHVVKHHTVKPISHLTRAQKQIYKGQ